MAMDNMTAILTAVGDIVTEAVDWVGSFATAITTNPIIEVFVLISLVGLGVGLLRRLIKL